MQRIATAKTMVETLEHQKTTYGHYHDGIWTLRHRRGERRFIDTHVGNSIIIFLESYGNIDWVHAVIEQVSLLAFDELDDNHTLSHR